MMKLILYTLIVFPAFSFPAMAQDVATEHTQILNNLELVMENLRILQSLYNEMQMIQNQVEELKSVATYQDGFSDTDSLRNQLTGITAQGTELSSQTQTILNQMQQVLNTLPANGTMTDQQESLDQDALTVVQNAINRTNQLRQSYQQQSDSLRSLMAKNNQAVGQTQALQTSNQLAAQNIAQTQSTQELLSEQISMLAAMMNKQFQQEMAEDEKMKQIIHPMDDGSSIFDPEN